MAEKEKSKGLREQILSQRGDRGLRREKVTIAGIEAWAWELSGKERTKVEQARCKTEKKGRVTSVSYDLSNDRALVIRLGVRDSGDDSGKRIFLSGDEQYIEELGASKTEEAYEAVLRLSGLTPEEVEEIRKNSSTTPNEEPSSDSRSDSDGALSIGVSGGSAVES
jgi:hypothetical protein